MKLDNINFTEPDKITKLLKIAVEHYDLQKRKE